MYMNVHTMKNIQLYVWMKNHISFWGKCVSHYPCVLVLTRKSILNISVMVHVVFLHLLNHWVATIMSA